MKLETERFGEIDIDEDLIVTFPNGLPGFEDLRQFIFIQENQDLPMAYMQSVEDGEVSFIIINPFAFVPNYEFELAEADEVELEIHNQEELRVWVIMNAGETLESSTINLLAPLIINFEAKICKQVVLHDTSYSTKHPLNSLGG